MAYNVGNEKVLVGEVITKIYVTSGDDYIKFETLSGKIIIGFAHGDCCSTSWIESIETPAL